jgi:GntR family transcriptional repressor for pyruvate dehydrogenase complex
MAHDSDWARSAMRDHLTRVSEDLLAVTELEMIENAKKEIGSKRQRLANGRLDR